MLINLFLSMVVMMLLFIITNFCATKYICVFTMGVIVITALLWYFPSKPLFERYKYLEAIHAITQQPQHNSTAVDKGK